MSTVGAPPIFQAIAQVTNADGSMTISVHWLQWFEEVGQAIDSLGNVTTVTDALSLQSFNYVPQPAVMQSDSQSILAGQIFGG